MKHIINFVCTYIQCLPMSAEVNKITNGNGEDEHIHDDKTLDATSTYANITSFICEVFLKIAVQYCHANMEYNVVNACLKAEFYNGTITYRIPTSLAGITEDDLIFNGTNKVHNG